MSTELLLFLFSNKALSLIQTLLCIKLLGFILNFLPAHELALFVTALLFDLCPLLFNRGLCEQLSYHHQVSSLGLYWSFEIIISGLLAITLQADFFSVLIACHGALLGRLFNLCLFSQLPGVFAKIACCLIAMPWFILLASYQGQEGFLNLLLSGMLFFFIFTLIWAVPPLLRWHLEPFEWELL